MYPAVYGSMFIDLKDFNNDGHMDILYVCGDNFDYSKPYHGIRILENDGTDSFTQKYFFSIYGAAKAEVNDYDGDGDLDILIGAMYLQNVLTIQKVNNAEDIEKKRASILVFENTLKKRINIA